MRHAETRDVAQVGLVPSWAPRRRLLNEPGHRRHRATWDPPASGASLGCSRRMSWGKDGGRCSLGSHPPPSAPTPASLPTCGRGCAGRSGLGRARTRAPGLLGSRSSPATSQLSRAPRAGGGGGAVWTRPLGGACPRRLARPYLSASISHLFCSCASLPVTSALLSRPSSFCPAPLLPLPASSSLRLPPSLSSLSPAPLLPRPCPPLLSACSLLSSPSL